MLFLDRRTSVAVFALALLCAAVGGFLRYLPLGSETSSKGRPADRVHGIRNETDVHFHRGEYGEVTEHSVAELVADSPNDRRRIPVQYARYQRGDVRVGYERLAQFTARVVPSGDVQYIEPFEVTEEELFELLQFAPSLNIEHTTHINKGPETTYIDIREKLNEGSMSAETIDPFLDFCVDTLIETKLLAAFFDKQRLSPASIEHELSDVESADKATLTFVIDGVQVAQALDIPPDMTVESKEHWLNYRVGVESRNLREHFSMENLRGRLHTGQSQLKLSLFAGEIDRDNLLRQLKNRVKIDKQYPEDYDYIKKFVNR